MGYVMMFCRKFCVESSGDRILKIDQYVAKLSTWVECLVFWLTVFTQCSKRSQKKRDTLLMSITLWNI